MIAHPAEQSADAGRLPLVAAAAQPVCAPGDVTANVEAHVRALHQARARLVVFPELSLTGYLMTTEPLAPDDAVLKPLVAACTATGAVALAGAPVSDGAGGKSLAVLAVSEDGAEVAYCKTFLGEEEPTHFTAGEGPAVVEVDGWRIGLGVCKDTGIAEHISTTAALGVDIYAAGLIHTADELAEQDARGRRIARTCAAHVIFASAAGPTGGSYDHTAGTSTVWRPNGTVLARAGAAQGQIARATIH